MKIEVAVVVCRGDLRSDTNDILGQTRHMCAYGYVWISRLAATC